MSRVSSFLSPYQSLSFVTVCGNMREPSIEHLLTKSPWISWIRYGQCRFMSRSCNSPGSLMRVKHRQNLDLPRVDAGRLVGKRNEHHEQPRQPHQVLCHVQAHLGQLRTADRHLVQVQHQDLCMCSSMLSGLCISAIMCKLACWEKHDLVWSCPGGDRYYWKLSLSYPTMLIPQERQNVQKYPNIVQYWSNI